MFFQFLVLALQFVVILLSYVLVRLLGFIWAVCWRILCIFNNFLVIILLATS